jgi:hypothetical protein
MQVKNVAVQIPYSTASYRIFYSGTRVRYETTFGLAVEYDGNWFIAVYVPSVYAGKMGGLCGNNDNDPTNDLTLANGTYVGSLANGATVFGDSYVVKDPEQMDTS